MLSRRINYLLYLILVFALSAVILLPKLFDQFSVHFRQSPRASPTAFAYATLLAPNPSLDDRPNAADSDDAYFIATRTLAHQLLHNPETSTNSSIPFIVIATNEVAPHKLERLRQDGAQVHVVKAIRASWLEPGQVKWRDMMSKLHVFTLTDYAKILMLDSDMLLTRNLDGIFTDKRHALPLKTNYSRSRPDEASLLPDTYLFAAQAYIASRNHAYPPASHEMTIFSGGFWLIQPCRKMFNYYNRVLQISGRFRSNAMEQDLLNYAHRRGARNGEDGVKLGPGPIPWVDLHYTWTTTWPSWKEYEMGAASLHEKWWDRSIKDLDPRLVQKWFDVRDRMLKYDGKS